MVYCFVWSRGQNLCLGLVTQASTYKPWLWHQIKMLALSDLRAKILASMPIFRPRPRPE